MKELKESPSTSSAQSFKQEKIIPYGAQKTLLCLIAKVNHKSLTSVLKTLIY